MTEVLQASQSHWGLLLRYEAVSPFSFAMSNPEAFSNILVVLVTSPNTRLEKNFLVHFKCVRF